MRFLAIGDIVGDCGQEYLKKHLASFKKDKKIDFVIANGENSANGNGTTKESLWQLVTSGVDVITSGNHIFKRKELGEFLDDKDFVIRPANYPNSHPGKGFRVIDKGRIKIFIFNLIGTVYMDENENPFITADKILESTDNSIKIKILDFHAEATSEKVAMGHYLAGRVSAVFGTHTHVQTADETILDNKTAYITDIGMTGAKDSVLGVKKDIVIKRLAFNEKHPFVQETGKCIFNGIIFDVDENTGYAYNISRVFLNED